MRLTTVIVFSLIAALAAASPTIFYEDENSGCVPLDSCLELKSKITKAHSKSVKEHHFATEELKKQGCGFEGNTPLVCCPPSISNRVFEISSGNSWNRYQVENKCVFPKYSGNVITQNFDNYLDSSEPSQRIEKTDVDNVFSECGKGSNHHHNSGNITEISDFPWLALLEFDTSKGKEFLCGGVLINNQYVLTSADCVTHPSHHLTRVHLGEYNLRASNDCEAKETADERCAVEIDVDAVIVHGDYNVDAIWPRQRDRFAHNVALLRLKAKVTFSQHVQPICLPESTSSERKFFIAGWGKSQIPNAVGLDVKRMSEVTLLQDCDIKHPELMLWEPEKYICAGVVGASEHPCFADGGGPLMGYERRENGEARISVFGISTMDQNCELNLKIPGVFTPLHEYKAWILENVKN